MSATDRLLVQRARGQSGLLHERDLVALTGRTDALRRRLRSDLWQEVLPGVLAPAVLDVDRGLLEAGSMLWAPAGLLSHYCAARRDGIWVPDDERVWLAVPFEDGHRSRPGVEVIRTRHPVERWETDGFVRWTPAPRTLVDLAQVLDERTLAAVLLSAVRRKKTTAAAVSAAAEPLAGRAGLAMLARVVGLWAPERESLLEDGLFADVVSVADGEVVERQYVVGNRSGVTLGRADVGIPELRLAFEADGLFFHSTDAQIAADQRRDRQFLGTGWQTARFREGALDDRTLVRADVKAIIEVRRRQLRAA
jgi:very-short-patch-repair endonuclease